MGHSRAQTEMTTWGCLPVGSPTAGERDGVRCNIYCSRTAHPVFTCFVDQEEAYECVPQGVLWGVLRENGVLGCHGCPLSLILCVTFMDRISRHSCGEESVWFGNLRIASLFFADEGGF